MARRLNGAREGPAPHDRIEGLEHLDKVIDIDQSPIGRTPRSNPATYTGAFTPIREWFAGLPEAKARGYEPGRFSFNVKGGRCEACQGDGVIKIEMHFLPDVYVTCDVCKGKRYNRETLDVMFKGKSIADVLDMTVEEAIEFFKAVPRIRNVLETLQRVGLGYIHVGQQATTLSGGEAQRVKLAKELCKRATGRTLYILDEPTTGLHFHDVAKLLEVLHELVDERQHGGGDRAQSRSDQDRRLDHRPRPRRRRRRRRDRRGRAAGGDREGEAQLYRGVSQAGAGTARGGAEAEDGGGGVAATYSNSSVRPLKEFLSGSISDRLPREGLAMTDVREGRFTLRWKHASAIVALSGAIVGFFLVLSASRVDLVSLFGLDFLFGPKDVFSPRENNAFKILVNLVAAVGLAAAFYVFRERAKRREELEFEWGCSLV